MSRIVRVDKPPILRAVFSSFRDALTPAWDRKFSPLQEMSRVAPRAAMGQKMSPRGRGRNQPRR
jgi:hypothetical protein